MSKFGELIKADVPVLIVIHTEWNEASLTMKPVIRDVAADLGDKAKVIKNRRGQKPGVNRGAPSERPSMLYGIQRWPTGLEEIGRSAQGRVVGEIKYLSVK